MTTPRCSLADLDTGDLYTTPHKDTGKVRIINRYVIAIDSNSKPPWERSFIMVTGVEREREVVRASMTSKTTWKTGVNISQYIYDIVYDKETETVIWAEYTYSGIWAQVLGQNSSTKYRVSELFSGSLELHKDKL